MIPLNDLSRKSPSQIDAEIECISEVVRSGHYMKGQKTEKLQQAISSKISGKHVLCVGNGTDALVLAMLGLGLESGDKIAVTPNGGGYSTTAALEIGLVPLLVDVVLETHQLDINSLKKTFEANPDLKSVVVTHLYGQLAEIEEIVQFCKTNNIRVIEDCAQAFGARKKGMWSGSWGDAATFSFYPTKNLGGLGDGGAVAFLSVKNFEAARDISQYGWAQRYVVSRMRGMNSRIDEIQAAVLLYRFDLLEVENAKRREIVLQYSKSLNNIRTIVGTNDEDFVGHLCVMVTPDRDSDTRSLESQGIATGIHYPVLDQHQPAWLEIFKGQATPVAEILVKQILTLPCFPELSQDEIKTVSKAISKL